MIVPMIKYSFLVYHIERDQFIHELMQVGVVQVISKGAVDDEYAQNLASDIKDGKYILSQFNKRKEVDTRLRENLEKPFPPLNEILDLEKELEKQHHELDGLETEIRLMEPWGNFSWKEVRRLENAGNFIMRFCRHPERKFDKKWHDNFIIEELKREGGFVYFVIFQKAENEELPVVPLALPKRSLNKLNEEKAVCNNRIAEINKELDYYSSRYKTDLEKGIFEAQDRLSVYLTTLHTNELVDDKLILLEGWCPKTKQNELLEYLNSNGIVYLETEPEENEIPPVLLKNNKFAQLFEPIGNMFSLPNYSEIDLTVYFAPFFMLFFGFCMGDFGYGLVIVLIASLLKFKIKGENQKYLTLLQLFGLSTIIIGLISGTFFGLQLAEESRFAEYKNYFLNQDQLFQTALYVGFVQIVFGMMVKVYKQVKFFGWLYAMNTLGWIILSFSILDLAILKITGSVSTIAAIVGLVLIVFFGSPKDGWLKSFGLGLADLYNITGVAGDLLSYIRLFALGASSAILGLVINQIALSAQSAFNGWGIIITVVFLIVGHTANMMLAGLSAFVHPMRLTFVEFYKNVGFIGGGKPYQPLAQKKKLD